MKRGGFTLLEVLVAALITAGIAGATATAVSQALRARESSSARQQAATRAATACDLVARDALNLIRSGDLYDARILLVDGELQGGASRDELLLFAHASRQTRSATDQNEGSACEVQYRLETPPESLLASGYILWRRSDPVPDEVPDGGGVATPVAMGITSLAIEVFDGSAWLDEWDSDSEGYPYALRITAQARDDSGKREAASRRTVALDRTPKPYATVESASGAASSTGGSR